MQLSVRERLRLSTEALKCAICQVLPVLSCAGSPRSEGGRPSATLRLRLGPEADSSAPSTSSAASIPMQHHSGSGRNGSVPSGHTSEPMAEAALRPVTLWLGLPLLARLEAFAEPLLLAAAEAAAAAAEAAAAEQQQQGGQRVAFEAAQGGQPPAAARKTAVAAAIDSILDSLQVSPAECQHLLLDRTATMAWVNHVAKQQECACVK